jgi:hypothetical protein
MGTIPMFCGIITALLHRNNKIPRHILTIDIAAFYCFDLLQVTLLRKNCLLWLEHAVKFLKIWTMFGRKPHIK